MIKKRRLFIDCETSPNIGFFWSSGFKLNIGYENIIHERSTICICYKWSGEKKVSYLTWDSKQCDKKMLTTFMRVMDQATEICGHNIDKYDLAWIRTRCLYHKIPVAPSYVTFDTLKFARSKFRFNSNRLDYLGKFLGIGQKIHTGFDLWKDIVLKNSPSAMAKMVKYCKKDVVLLETVFNKMINHLPAKTHYGVKYGGLKRDCPECGGETVVTMTKVSAQGVKKHQMKCKNCGKMHTVQAVKSIK